MLVHIFTRQVSLDRSVNSFSIIYKIYQPMTSMDSRNPFNREVFTCQYRCCCWWLWLLLVVVVGCGCGCCCCCPGTGRCIWANSFFKEATCSVHTHSNMPGTLTPLIWSLFEFFRKCIVFFLEVWHANNSVIILYYFQTAKSLKLLKLKHVL